jgi:hypothetical protein
MKSTLVLLSILAGSFLSPVAHAQMFYSSMAASADTDVFSSGNTAFAFSFYDENNATTSSVNGVTFGGVFTDPTTGVGFSYDNLGSGDQNGTTLTASTGGTPISQNYVNILTNLHYNSNATSDLVFTGLTKGDSYELQVFGGGGATTTETLTDGTASGSLAYGSGNNPGDTGFVNETFTAASSTETVAVSNTSYIVFNAVNLQDTTVPEPSTYAMLFGGIGLLVLVSRLRNKLTA